MGGERSDDAWRCAVMQDHERCLSPNPPECRISPASASSGLSRPVSADGAQPTLLSSLALPCPEKHLSSSLASSKTDGVKHRTKALVSPVALHPCAPGDVCCDPLCYDMFILFSKYFFTGSCTGELGRASLGCKTSGHSQLKATAAS